MEIEEETRAILFADMSGFSKIRGDAYVQTFVKSVLMPIGTVVGHMGAKCEINTWGDGVFALFQSPVDCARFAIQIRDLFQQNLVHEGLPIQLGLRASLHQGLVYRFQDPIRNVRTALGQQINLAARIEPVVAPGAVWTTEEFKVGYKATGANEVVFDSLGMQELAKGFPSRRLFHMRRPNERRRTHRPRKGSDSAIPAAVEYDIRVKESRLATIYKELGELVTDPQVRQLVTEMYRLAFPQTS